MDVSSSTSLSSMQRVRVILVRPQVAGNIGAVARAMENFAAGQLVLVSPKPGPTDREALARSTHGEHRLHSARVVSTLEEALDGVVFAIGTSRRRGPVHQQRDYSSRDLGGLIAEHIDEGDVALLFGTEDNGLSREDLRACDAVVQIPAGEGYPTLNLSHAAAVCLYEAFIGLSEPRAPAGESEPRAPATGESEPRVPAAGESEPGAPTTGIGVESEAPAAGAGAVPEAGGPAPCPPPFPSLVRGGFGGVGAQAARPLARPEAPPGPSRPRRSDPADLALMERLMAKLQHALLTIGYLHAEKPDHLMFPIRAILSRARLTRGEAQILIGLAQQIDEFAQYGKKGGAGPKPET